MKKNNGLTLIEVLVALTVLSIFFVMLLSAILAVNDIFYKSANMRSDLEEAMRTLEQDEGNTIPGSSIKLYVGSTSITVSGQYRYYDNGISKLILFETVE